MLLAASQFFITLEDGNQDCSASFGQVAEGFDVLDLITKSICDQNSAPLVDIVIKHVVILDDPFDGFVYFYNRSCWLNLPKFTAIRSC